MTNEDIEDIKTIAQEVKDMTIKFDLSYDQSAVEELLYDVGMSMRAILEIINGPSGTVERMV
jgi:transposase